MWKDGCYARDTERGCIGLLLKTRSFEVLNFLRKNLLNLVVTENSHKLLIGEINYHNICTGVSTSGMAFKHPGRIGDSPLPGSGLYADDEVLHKYCKINELEHF